jgi:hypothetical protein
MRPRPPSVLAPSTLLVAAMALSSGAATAQDTAVAAAADRYGVWEIRSDAPPPARNVMTYEPYGEGGMKITVESTNAAGERNTWGYVTMFDGEFRTVDGQENATTAVEVVDARTTRISNARDGRVYQVILNTLSPDGNTIENEYIRLDDAGRPVRVSHATYDRIR